MTTSVRDCPTCSTAIPAGALFCIQCGASSPTEIAGAHADAPAPAAPLDLEARRAEVKAALGDGFEVRGLVGRGGFGEVWAALDVHLKRDVAVKVLHASLTSNHEYRERFRREARAIARLRHPGIVPIYHVGESHGLVFFIMPLVDGMTLKAAMGQPGGLSGDEAVRLLLEVVAALKEAHAHGIVHRDLKPENIMLEGPQRRALIMDFGVAKMEEAGAEGLTEADMVVGSPEYMSPEQATGRELDARSDIYSLGVVAYRMIAGRLPFIAATPREVLAHHVLSAPDPLESHTVLPESLNDTIMRCLAKNPIERWQSADELLLALTVAAPRRSQLAAIAPRPLATRKVPPVARPLSRRTVLWALAVAVLVVAVATPWPIARWRQRQQWMTAATISSGLYRQAADSIDALAAAFSAGDITGPQYLAGRDERLFVTEANIEESFGDAMDDSLRWTDSARGLLRSALLRASSAGLEGGVLGLRPSDVAGCVMRLRGDTTILRDQAADDNCWWQATGARAVRSPVEYSARFRTTGPPLEDAGVGLAWCRSDGDCRVAFLWPRSGMVWGAHRPHRGLNVMQTGRRTPLAAGEHDLRVRYQDGVMRAWLDGGLVLERRTTAESPYLERAGSLHFVVQNALIELAGPEALGMVGGRQGP